MNFSLLPPSHLPAICAGWPLALVLGLAGCKTTAPEATPITASAAATMAPEIPGLATYDYATSMDPLTALDAAVANAGKNPAKVSALVAGLTETLRSPATSFAARQAICERLGHLLIDAAGGELTASHPTLAVLAPWLEDAKLAPVALLALERVPGRAIDQLIQKAAPRAYGPTRQALQTCLDRRQPAVRFAALDLLSDIAPISEQAAVLQWTWQQTAEEDLTRAQRALIAITQRAAKPADGVRVVLAALEKAPPAVQVRQLRLLPRLADADSFAFAKRLAASSDPAVAAAANSAVDRWPKPTEAKK